MRSFKKASLTIAQSAALSDELEFTEEWETLVIHMPAAWTTASMGFKTASATSGTFQALYDDNAALLQIDGPSASKDYRAPSGIDAAGYLKLWSQNGSGVDTTQGAARTIVVTLKK